MNVDMKNNIKGNIKSESENSILDNDIKDEDTREKIPEVIFKIIKKKNDKAEKKSFPLYIDEDVLKELDLAVKKSKFSRNELVNLMIKACLKNIEITDK